MSLTCELRDIVKRFGDVAVLDGLSASFSDERPTCLVGPSGCGKTTFGRILLGLLAPDSGQRIVPAGLRTSAAFQEDRLLPGLSALGNLRLVLPRGADCEQLAGELLATGLAIEDLHRPAAELSGGMRRRVAVVRAVVAPSQLVLLDEPFTGLDADTHALLLDYLRPRLQNRIAVLITHDPADADALGAKVLAL